MVAEIRKRLSHEIDLLTMELSYRHKVAIAILNYNGKDYLQACLDSLKEISYLNHDIILIDNDSSDDSVKMTKEYFPWVKIIPFSENYGFGKAYNMAIKQLEYEYILLLNNDTIVEKSFVEELMNIMLDDPRIAICGSKILMMDNPHIIAHAGGKISQLGTGIDIGLGLSDTHRYDHLTDAGFVCGASMLVRRDIFLELGGFDPDYFAYNDDVDLCWRVWLKGYRVVYVPTSIIYHKCGGSWDRKGYKKILIGECNRLQNMLKNLEVLNLPCALLASISYDLLRFCMSLCRRNYEESKAILDANKYTIKHIPNIRRKRRYIQSSRLTPDRVLKDKAIFATFKECLSEFVRLKVRNC